MNTLWTILYRSIEHRTQRKRGPNRSRRSKFARSEGQALLSRTIQRTCRSDGTIRTVAFGRISVDHRVMGGVACIVGTRIPVATVVSMLADGMTTDEILASYPPLDGEAIRASLQYAAATLRERELPLLSPA